MGKVHSSRSLGPDDPIYTGGVQLFTPGRFRPSPHEQAAEPEPDQPKPPTQLKPGEVEVSVEWFGTMSMVLDAAEWKSIKRGKRHWVETVQANDDIEWRWRFNIVERGLLVVDCGDDSAQEAHRKISELPVRVGPSP